MTELIPHVDWSLALAAIVFVAAIGHFVQNQVRLFKDHDLYAGLSSLGMAFVLGTAAIQIAYPQAITGSGAVGLITKLCFIIGAALMIVSFIGDSIPRILDHLPRFSRGKHTSAPVAHQG